MTEAVTGEDKLFPATVFDLRCVAPAPVPAAPPDHRGKAKWSAS
ncbi:hypothetical protein [Streptomyces anulatus]